MRTILVVDDETSVRRLLVRFLLGLGYETLEAENGNAALALAEQTPSIDLLLTDVVLTGGINGMELFHRLRVYRPHLRVVFISGYTNRGALTELELMGLPQLSKPFARAHLDEVLQRVFSNVGPGGPGKGPA